MLNHQQKNALYTTVAVLGGIAFVGFIVWFHLNYKCVSSHMEWRSSCHVNRDSHGRRISEHCRQYQTEVCDEYVER